MAQSLQTPCRNQRQIKRKNLFFSDLCFWDEKSTTLGQIQSCKCSFSLFCQPSFRSSVVSIKCRFDQVSFRSSVVSINCHFNQGLFDQGSFDQLSGHDLHYNLIVV